MGLLTYMALFTMSFITISISHIPCSSSFAAAALNAITCYPPDLAALRTFAASFPSADFSDWEASDDCCGWGPSVDCSSTSTSTQNVSSEWIVGAGRRVTKLSLDGEERFASGGRSFEPNMFPLCALSALSSLKLWGGWLSGPIPDCIATNLTNLVELQLSSNGALSGTIPPSFSRLRSLQTLSLSDNSLSGPFPSFLSDGLLPNLTFLSLSFNSFNGSLPAAFRAPNLIYLSLASNSFTGSIPAFNSCPHLALLFLSRNSFSGSISRRLFAPVLSSLDLSYNSLSGAMPDLSLLPSLLSLHLSNNLLNGSIPESLCQHAELQELDLSSNAFSGQLFASAGALCGWPKFSNLSSLSLSHNQLVGPFPSGLGYLSKLQLLDLSYNSFKGSIPSSWQNLSSVISLELSGNTLVPADPSAPSLPPWLFQLPYIRNMGLSSTGIHLGCSWPHLPLFNTSLQYNQGDLDISFNNLSADGLRCFLEPFTMLSTLNLSGNPLALNLNNPKEVEILPQITYILDLSSCELTGSLTDLFFDRLMPSGISELHLAKNQLVGRIPAQLSNLSSLWFLDLAHNSFTSFEAGGIPWDVLQSIDLSYNMFTGSLSSFLVGLTNRTNSEEVICVHKPSDLDLSHNFLTGSIPPSVGHCIDRRIKLNNNNLEGFIPKYLFENMTDNGPKFLSLSNNQLRGEIPPSIKKLKHLKLLDLGHNELQGNLEATLFTNASDQFMDLRVLILGYNLFTGSIPVSLGRFMPALQVIDMSNNQISGLIPESLHDLPAFRIVERPQSGLATHGTLFEEIRINVKGNSLDYQYVLQLLTSLDLSGNNLSGPMPTGLGALSGLVYLDFSRNKLSGQIPPDLGMLGEQLQSLDLSFNELVGSIPTSFDSLTKLALFNVSYNKGLCGSIPSSPQFVTADSYIGDPDLCGESILRPCTIDNCASTQRGTIRNKSGQQQSSFARWIDEWITIPGLCLGILIGFVGTLWALISCNK